MLYKCLQVYIFALISGIIMNEAKKIHTVELTHEWVLRNLNGSIQVPVPKIPSGVYSALMDKYGDILHSENDVDLRWIANETWIYSQTFDDEVRLESMVNLTFHGVDTIGHIRLNNNLLGSTHNMFVRYTFDVTNLLQPKGNKLDIELLSPLKAAKEWANELLEKNLIYPPVCSRSLDHLECHQNMLRKLQMSFGGERNLVAPSMGIWKPIVLEYYEAAIMREIDVATRKNETHWTLDIRVFLSTGIMQNFYVNLTLFATELLDKPFGIGLREINLAKLLLEFEIHIPKNRVKLWWPNGYGDQKLYPLLIIMKSWVDANGPQMSAFTTSQKTIKIGFRTIELVEDIDDRGRTFYFKVNDHPMFMKGANYVPAHILPEFSADIEKVEHLIKSAKDVNMNMIRVWGGGLYESDEFYSLTDYYGLLVWQDMAFSAATYPVTDFFLESVRRETSQNAKRLAYHPSLALIVTNNEIELFLAKNRSDFVSEGGRLEEEYKLLFMGTIRYELSIIARNNYNPRPGPMISTPSLGIEESKKDLAVDPQNPNYGDVHFWDSSDTYPRARFISELGYPSLPTTSSWVRTLGNGDTLAAIIKHRQHDAKGFETLLRLIKDQLPFNFQNWEENIEEFIYFSQVAQAMNARTAVDVFRSERFENNTMGILILQLNDVWVASSWSCIDFYGNQKLIYYWSKEFFEPTRAIALYDTKNDVINITLTREDYTDYRNSRSYTVVLNTYLWSELFPKKSITWDSILDSNYISRHYINFKSALVEDVENSSCFFKISLIEDKKTVSSSFLFPWPIKQAKGVKNPELAIVVRSTSDISSYSIEVSIKYPALFVYMELNHSKVEKYTFSENGFIQVEPVKIIHLKVINNSERIDLNVKHIKFITMNQFMI